MIIVDDELRRRDELGEPVRVGIVGAGAMGRGVALQIAALPGMEIAAVCNRRTDRALAALSDAGYVDPIEVDDAETLGAAASAGRVAVTDDARALVNSDAVDVIVELTGAIEYGANVIFDAIDAGKHVVCTAELHGTVGPILKRYADDRGVVFTDIDGDQPAAIVNLMRFARTIGLEPVLAGNVKSLQDHYRTPATQEAFAREHGLSPEMATSFADGTKISFEMSVVSHATGFGVGTRGMFGPRCTHVDEALSVFDLDQLLSEPIVDYVIGAQPAAGVFVIAHEAHAVHRHYLRLYKLGEGPFYVLHTPYHLGYFEVPVTIARAVLFGDAAAAPIAGPVVEVVATAKRALAVGEVLDGLGGYTVYGQCENAAVTKAERLLPIGVAEGCRLARDVRQDDVLTYDDVELPPGRLVDRLRAEQDAGFDA